MAAYDFKVNEDGGLFTDPVELDFVIVPSDPQHTRDLMLSAPGWTKEFPFAGFDPYSKINAKANKQSYIRDATIALVNDGYTKGPKGIDFDIIDGKIIIKVMDVFRV